MTGYDKVIIAAMKPLAMLWFLFRRAVGHDLFLRQRCLSGSHIWLRPFGLVFRAGGVVARCWRAASAASALKIYSGRLARHYGPQGLAYGHLTAGSAEELHYRFKRQRGRLRFYMDDRRLLDFSDGESFLDCGCGPGQNVAELRRAFPASAVKAFDFSAEAVEVVRIGTAGDPLVTAEQGSVLDAAYLAAYPTGSFDHVLVSHVLGFMLCATLEETRSVRQHIIDELVRIARRTVIVLDAVEIKRRELSVTIEQRDRGFVHDDLTKYFEGHDGTGTLYIMLSPEDEGIIFRKAPNTAIPAI